VALHKIEETLEETIASVREVSNNLSPNTLVNFGLEAAISTILERISEFSDLNCKLTVDIENRLPFDLEATIFRIVGESINNTVKHAQAKQINVTIAKQNGSIIIDYQDDGIGFNISQPGAIGKGNGLSNMRSRVLSMGGEININAAPNKGTHIICKFFV
jgi:signal transduction histidine kinase